MTISEPSAENKTLVGKANSFIQQLISNPLEQTTQSNILPVAHRPGSPRSLALQKNDLEAEYMHEISHMTAAIQQKQFELQSLPEAEDKNDMRNVLESELKILKEEAAIFSDSKFKAAQALEAESGLKQDEEMKEMDDAVSKIKRIVVVLEPDTLKRTLKPVRYFSDLQAQIESFHPGFIG